MARANGERTNKEAKNLKKAADTEKMRKEDALKNVELVSTELKNLEDEKRNLERRLKSKLDDKDNYNKKLEKLLLENDMTAMELKKIMKKKENNMVQHDIMKLEIRKI